MSFLFPRAKHSHPTKLHPKYSGGEEVLLDVAGKDATEEFEDVGHSDGAREMLNDLFVGRLKRLVSCDPVTNPYDHGC